MSNALPPPAQAEGREENPPRLDAEREGDGALNPAEPLPSAPIAPGHEPVEGEAYIILLLLVLTTAVLALAMTYVLIAVWRASTGAAKGDEPEWLALVALGCALGVMYAFADPIVALFRLVAGPIWLAIFIPFLLAAIVALLALVVGAVGQVVGSIVAEGWEAIVGWTVFIALVAALNLYFDWNVWWALAGAFAIFTAVALAVFGLYSLTKSKE